MTSHRLRMMSANVVAVDLEGTVNSLQVKAVADKEYLYTVTSQPPIRVTPSQPPTTPTNLPVPVKPSVKLIIFNSDGNKIKEANLDEEPELEHDVGNRGHLVFFSYRQMSPHAWLSVEARLGGKLA